MKNRNRWSPYGWCFGYIIYLLKLFELMYIPWRFDPFHKLCRLDLGEGIQTSDVSDLIIYKDELFMFHIILVDEVELLHLSIIFLLSGAMMMYHQIYILR